jgi:hypothetical protein
MIAPIPIPRVITHDESGAVIVFGWSPQENGAIRYDVSCACGDNRLELFAPPHTDPEAHLWVAASYHQEHFPDCTCLGDELVNRPIAKVSIIGSN